MRPTPAGSAPISSTIWMAPRRTGAGRSGLPPSTASGPSSGACSAASSTRLSKSAASSAAHGSCGCRRAGSASCRSASLKTRPASVGSPTTTRSSTRQASKRSPRGKHSSPTPKRATLAAVVNPTGDLPGTEKEGALVAAHFASADRTVLEGEAATPDAVIAALKGKTHWHFASHGTFSWADARQSALLMHDAAPLSVGRLLETDGLGRPRLVVLSACETGLSDITSSPDEFIGLPGAFTALGAAGVLGTLWPVSDAATALLMAKFYDLHLEAGLDPPAALSGAQAWLRNATARAISTAMPRSLRRADGCKSVRSHRSQTNSMLESLGRSRRNTPLVPMTEGNETGTVQTPSPPRPAHPYAHPYYWAGFIYTGQ